MGLVIRIYDINSPNDFKVSIKKGDTAYPLDSGYIEYDTIYSGGTTQIELTNITYPSGKTENFDFNTQYWIKITDITTDRYIIENIYLHDQIAFSDCQCSPPIILSAECYTNKL